MALCHVGHSSCVPGEHIHRALAHHEGTSQDEETGTQKALVTSIGILSYDRGPLQHLPPCFLLLLPTLYSHQRITMNHPTT